MSRDMTKTGREGVDCVQEKQFRAAVLLVAGQAAGRIERNFIITTCLRGTMRRFAEWLRFLALGTLRLARDLAVERLVRSAIRELHQLDATRALVRLL